MSDLLSFDDVIRVSVLKPDYHSLMTYKLFIVFIIFIIIFIIIIVINITIIIIL